MSSSTTCDSSSRPRIKKTYGGVKKPRPSLSLSTNTTSSPRHPSSSSSPAAGGSSAFWLDEAEERSSFQSTSTSFASTSTLTSPPTSSDPPSSSFSSSSNKRPSSTHSSLLPPPAKKKKKSTTSKPLEQLFLNPFLTSGHTTLHCNSCGLSYARTPGDIELHKKHHARVVGGCDWVGEERERECGAVEVEREVEWGGNRGGRVVLVDASVGGIVGKRINDILSHIDLSLSSSPLSDAQLAESKIAILVTRDKKVVGAAVAQRIQESFEVLPSGQRGESSGSEEGEKLLKFGEDDGAVFCSPTPLPTLLGIHRIYVSPSHRRYSLASTLLDAIANRFFYASPIEGQERRRREIAFSQPTGDGTRLAMSWTGVKETGELGGGGWRVFVD